MLFSRIRACGGHNTNPSALSFISAVRKVLLCRLRHFRYTGNVSALCAEDTEEVGWTPVPSSLVEDDVVSTDVTEEVRYSGLIRVNTTSRDFIYETIGGADFSTSVTSWIVPFLPFISI